MNILVTGGAGYIGSHTTEVVEAAGHKAVIYDNLSTGFKAAAKSRQLIVADLSERTTLCRALQEYSIDAVIHFAGSAYVGESVIHPRTYFQNNVVNSLNLLDAMLDSGVRYIVYSSTCATYGIPDKVPISEDQSQHPVNPYGESKLFVERALAGYGKAYGLRWIALRYFNAAGAAFGLGECHSPETHLIPLAIRAASGGPPLSVFGADYPTPDGTAMRDYVHVSDLAAAHLLALDYLFQGKESRAFNLGVGRGYSVQEVVQMVEEVAHAPVCRRLDQRRPGDPPILVADSEAAHRILKWTAKFSLREIIESAWLWHSKHCTTQGLR